MKAEGWDSIEAQFEQYETRSAIQTGFTPSTWGCFQRCSLHHPKQPHVLGVITHGLWSSFGPACLDKARNQGKMQLYISCHHKLDHNVCEITQCKEHWCSRLVLCVCRNRNCESHSGSETMLLGGFKLQGMPSLRLL
jgi:hypothetical protein